MTTNTTLVLGDLIEMTLDELYSELERPRPTQLGANITSTQTTITLVGFDYVSVTDILEVGNELMTVTAKTSDANPTFTVIRGYSATTAIAHTTTETVLINPHWTRNMVTRAINQFYTGSAPALLPYIRADVMNTASKAGVGQQLIPLAADVIRVLEVRYQSPTSGRIVDLYGWRHEDNLPTAISSSGMGLRISSVVSPTDDLLVTMKARYQWVGVGETATIQVPMGTEDIAPAHAAARLLSGREISRLELDRLIESANDTAVRSGSNLGLIKLRWQEVYRRIDEAKRLLPVPRPLVFRRFQNG